MLKDIRPGTRSGDPLRLTDLGNGRIVFAAAVSGAYGLWTSDGTAEGTVLVRDIWPTGNAWPREITPLGDGRALLLANDNIHGEELWVTDGTSAGTMFVKDLIPDARVITNTRIVSLGNGRGLVAAQITNPISGGGTWQVWVSDGSVAGTTVLLDNLDYGVVLFAFGNGNALVVRTTPDPIPGAPYLSRDIWLSDGTTAGTIHLNEEMPPLPPTGKAPQHLPPRRADHRFLLRDARRWPGGLGSLIDARGTPSIPTWSRGFPTAPRPEPTGYWTHGRGLGSSRTGS